jgi:hypothetical protein
MPAVLKKLEDEALKFPARSRARLAERLLEHAQTITNHESPSTSCTTALEKNSLSGGYAPFSLYCINDALGLKTLELVQPRPAFAGKHQWRYGEVSSIF